MTAVFEVAGASETVWPAELGGYLSASRLTKFQICPEAFRRRYVLGEREPSSGPLVWGSADTYAAGLNYRQKIDSHEDLSVADVKLAFAEGFDEAAGREEVVWGDDKPGELKDAGVALAAAYHTVIAPKVQPLSVEERIEVAVPGVPVPIIGFVDVTEAADTIERKTAGRKAVVVQPQWRVQGLVYLLARRQPVHYHVSVKTKTPSVYSAHDEPQLVLDAPLIVAERFLARLADQLIATYERYGPDTPWPGNLTHTWACDLCAFRPTCTWWAQ